MIEDSCENFGDAGRKWVCTKPTGAVPLQWTEKLWQCEARILCGNVSWNSSGPWSNWCAQWWSGEASFAKGVFSFFLLQLETTPVQPEVVAGGAGESVWCQHSLSSATWLSGCWTLSKQQERAPESWCARHLSQMVGFSSAILTTTSLLSGESCTAGARVGWNLRSQSCGACCPFWERQPSVPDAGVQKTWAWWRQEQWVWGKTKFGGRVVLGVLSIDQSICRSVDLSTYLSVYLCIYVSMYQWPHSSKENPLHSRRRSGNVRGFHRALRKLWRSGKMWRRTSKSGSQICDESERRPSWGQRKIEEEDFESSFRKAAPGLGWNRKDKWEGEWKSCGSCLRTTVPHTKNLVNEKDMVLATADNGWTNEHDMARIWISTSKPEVWSNPKELPGPDADTTGIQQNTHHTVPPAIADRSEGFPSFSFSFHLLIFFYIFWFFSFFSFFQFLHFFIFSIFSFFFFFSFLSLPPSPSPRHNSGWEKKKEERRKKKNAPTETGPLPQSHAQDLFCYSCAWKPLTPTWAVEKPTIGRSERATRHLLRSGRRSWLWGNHEQCQKEHWKWGGPQGCRAKSRNQPTWEVQAGGHLVQVIGLKNRHEKMEEFTFQTRLGET